MKILAMTVSLSLLLACAALAQSSGNFTYGSNSQTERCVLNNDNTGTISGGQTCSLGTAGPACTTNADCTVAGTFCFNPSGGTLAGECVAASSGAPCTSNSQCVAPETCVIPNGAASGTCGLVENGVCIVSFRQGCVS